jgi:hypothetical protein
LTRRGAYYVQAEGYQKRKKEKAAEDRQREKARKTGKEKTTIPAAYLRASNHKSSSLELFKKRRAMLEYQLHGLGRLQVDRNGSKAVNGAFIQRNKGFGTSLLPHQGGRV